MSPEAVVHCSARNSRSLHSGGKLEVLRFVSSSRLSAKLCKTGGKPGKEANPVILYSFLHLKDEKAA